MNKLTYLAGGFLLGGVVGTLATYSYMYKKHQQLEETLWNELNDTIDDFEDQINSNNVEDISQNVPNDLSPTDWDGLLTTNPISRDTFYKEYPEIPIFEVEMFTDINNNRRYNTWQAYQINDGGDLFLELWSGGVISYVDDNFNADEDVIVFVNENALTKPLYAIMISESDSEYEV